MFECNLYIVAADCMQFMTEWVGGASILEAFFAILPNIVVYTSFRVKLQSVFGLVISRSYALQGSERQ